MKKPKKPIILLPFCVYFTTIALLIITGFIDSIYLAWSHYRNYTDIEYQSFCAISKSINCDTVSQSSYSIFFSLPLAVWGLIGYGFLILLLPHLWSIRAQKKRIWTIFFLIAIIFSFVSIALSIVSTVYIQSYCIMCVLSFGVNFLLLYFTWLIRRRYEISSFFGDLKQDINYLRVGGTKNGLIFSLFFCGVILIIIFFPKYWAFKISNTYSALPVGVTQDGHPWIGAEHPILEITEFTDYQCFQCKKMHHYLRKIMMEHPDKIRLIHRNYPLDSKYNFAVKEKFHDGSAELALLAIYASLKGKFWEMNDLLYSLQIKDGQIKLKDLANKMQFDFLDLRVSLHSKKIINILQLDLWEGFKLGIKGTPAYVINGNVYRGNIPSEIINAAIGSSD
jgi:protein-disulfide isomerase/uncharacterized membrane protein